MKLFRYLGIFLAVFLFTANHARSQCSFSVDLTKACFGSTIQFTATYSGSGTVASYRWIYGDGNGQPTTQNPENYVYSKKPGTFKPQVIIYLTNGDSCFTDANNPPAFVTIYPSPQPGMYLSSFTKDTQCFEGNYFCMVDTSRTDSITHSKIIRRIIDWQDGSKDSTGADWGGIDTICHTYIDPAGGTYYPVFDIIDSNGCTKRIQLGPLVVQSILDPKFQTSFKLKCDSTDVLFTNQTSIGINQIKKFRWEFGDGTSYTSLTPPSAIDKVQHWTNFKHWYYKQGPFKAKLYVESVFGCKDSFTLVNAGDNVFLELNPTVEEDTMCWAGNIVKFHQNPLFIPFSGKQQVYWIHINSAGKPDPNPLEFIDSGTWDPTHSYVVCGPPTITLLVVQPPCKKQLVIDSIMLYGPMAAIESPPTSMIADTERHQCNVIDSVHFPNNSQTCGIKGLEYYWDFDDGGNPNSLNDTSYSNYYGMSKNAGKNTNFSRDWTPVHSYDTSHTSARCHTARLIMKGYFYKWNYALQDSEKVECFSDNSVPLALRPPKADSLKAEPAGAGFCLGPMPPYGVKFKWSKSKPGCTQQHVSICFDSACCAHPFGPKWPKDPNCWTPQEGFNIPPWSPFPVWPTSYSRAYLSVCDPCNEGWVTVGFAVDNRGDEINMTNGKPCIDTVWYHHMLRFVDNNPNYTTNIPSTTGLPGYICGHGQDTLIAKPSSEFQDSITSYAWRLLGPGLRYERVDSIWRRPKYKHIRYVFEAGTITSQQDITGQFQRYVSDSFYYGCTDTIHFVNDTVEVTRIDSFVYIFDKPGDYRLYLELGNSDGCSGTKARRILVGNYSELQHTSNAQVSDTIVCYGANKVDFNAFIRYWHPIGPPIYPYVYDTTDFWRDPIQVRKNRGQTKMPAQLEELHWYFDDNVNPTSRFESPSHVFSHPGIFNVRLNWIDSSGCLDTAYVKIYVQGVKAHFVKNFSSLACDAPIKFFDSSYVVGPCDYSGSPCLDSVIEHYWYFGDSTARSVLKNPIHRYLSNGTFKVTHIVQSFFGCWDTTEQYITIFGPNPRIKVTSDTVGCAPLTVNFINFSDTGVHEFVYRFGDGKIKTSSDTLPFSHTYTDTGLFYVFVDGTGPVYDSIAKTWRNCTRTYPDTPRNAPIIIRVLPSPKAHTDGDKILCLGDTARFWNMSDSTYTSLIWEFGDSTTDSLQRTAPSAHDTIRHVYTKPGRYTVRFKPRYSNIYGKICPHEDSLNVIVSQVIANALVDHTLSEQPKFFFKDSSVSYPDLTSVVKYDWDFGHILAGSGNQSDLKDPSHDYQTDTGEYIVRQIVVNNYGCKDTDTVHVSNLYRVKIKIPNVFTPDHDDTNDTYQIYAEGLVKGDSDAYHLVIFNEWGERMFETHTQGNGWDGKNFGDRDCPTGTYYYIFFWKPKAWIDLKKDQDYGSQTEVTDVSTTDSNGKKIPRGKATGTITLLRKN